MNVFSTVLAIFGASVALIFTFGIGFVCGIMVAENDKINPVVNYDYPKTVDADFVE